MKTIPLSQGIVALVDDDGNGEFKPQALAEATGG